MRLLQKVNPLTSLYNQFNLSKNTRKDLSLVIVSLGCFMVYFPITTGASITGFATKLGAGDFFYSLLVALPVLGNIFQIFASMLLEHTNKRKSLFIAAGFIQRAPWILIGLVPLIVGDSINPILFIIPLLVVSSIPNSMLGVGFNSWMSDLIPNRMMGRYLGIREAVGTFICMVVALLVSLFLDHNDSFTAYAIIFSIAAIAGIIDICNFFFITDVPMERHPRPPLLGFIKKAFSNVSYKRYIVFWALWSFTFNLSGAFYNLYALSYLKLSFVQVAIAGQIAYSIVATVVAPLWGKLIDTKGVKYVLMRAGIISSIIPCIMLFSVKGSMWTFLIFNLLNGLSLTAINTTAQNMLLGTTPSKNRTMYIAIYSVATSLCAFAGFLIGGAVLELQATAGIWEGFANMDRYKVLFTTVGFMRLALILGLTSKMTKSISENE